MARVPKMLRVRGKGAPEWEVMLVRVLERWNSRFKRISELISLWKILKIIEISVSSSNHTHANANNDAPIASSASAVLNMPTVSRDVRNG